jgi:hypothetical protein
VLGPLDEKEATLGDNTPFPTTVAVGETFITGLLACHRKKYMKTQGKKGRKLKHFLSVSVERSYLATWIYDEILCAISKSTTAQGTMPSHKVRISRMLIV